MHLISRNMIVYRKKSRWELTRISAAVMGIEFSYAAETAFVSPTLLKIGKKMFSQQRSFAACFNKIMS